MFHRKKSAGAFGAGKRAARQRQRYDIHPDESRFPHPNQVYRSEEKILQTG